MPADKTLIIGIGNMLCCDEGVGVQVIQQMEFMELPGHIELLDMGTSTTDLISHLEGVKKLIVIDAMKTGGIPGEIHKCKPEDLMSKGEEAISLHEVNLLETLTTAKQMGKEIDTVIIGVEPKVIDWGLELSEEVKKKIPAIIEAVLKES
jgi:hydrogenase maturation protease